MSSASEAGRPRRPQLRNIELIRVPGRGGLVTVLRDGEGVATRNVEVPPPLDRALFYMDGRHELSGIARLAGVSLADVERLARDLEQAAMLEGPTASARRRALIAAFHEAPDRAPSFAGGAYHADPVELEQFIARSFSTPREVGRAIRGLVAPHMDLWRAVDGYASSYGALAHELPSDLDLIVVLGTCHAGMRSPFAFTRKSFRTPFGVMTTDADLAARVAAGSGLDVFADEYKHKGEHSIEFQIVYLQHVLGERAREICVLPVLCGLSRAQSTRTDPSRDEDASRVLGALVEQVAGKNVLVVAGADLAHVGPRFGDPEPLDATGRDRLRDRDAQTLQRLLQVDAAGFFDHVTEDLDTRRVCGTGPLYTFLRLLEAVGPVEAELFGYTQHIDPDEGSIVSHASAAFRPAM